MKKADLLKLLLIPILLICLAAFTFLRSQALVPDFITGEQESKYDRVIAGIENGTIQPSNKQVIEFLRSDLESGKTRKIYDNSIRDVFHTLAGLLAALGLIQCFLVVAVHKKKSAN